MTDKQPEALRLSDELDAEAGRITQYTNRPGDLLRELAADELRRLHADNETLRTGYAAARLEIESLKVQIAERASHGQAPAGESLRTDALCDLSYSHGLKAGWNYCASDDLAGFERAQKIGAEALRTLKSTTAQAAPAATGDDREGNDADH